MHTETIQCLTGLAIGDRAWFWLCPDISIDGDRLVLTAFKSDPGMDALEAAVDGIDIPIGAQYYMGILQVQGDGTCAFGGLQLNAAALFALAEWVRHHADAQPELALLCHSTLNTVNPAGQVTFRYDIPNAWDEILPVHRPMSLFDSLSTIEALPNGVDAWFWLTNSGPDGGPHLCVASKADDEDGEAFQSAVEPLAKRSKGRVTYGMLRKDESEDLMFIVGGKAEHWQDDLDALIGRYLERIPGLYALTQSSVVRLGKGRVRDRLPFVNRHHPIPSEADSLDSEVDAPIELDTQLLSGWSGAPLYFSFGHLGLRISEQAFDGLQNVEGRFRRRSKGGVEFRCANASANTISELAEWIESEVDDHPELAELIDARLSVCDDSGEVIERYRDDDAWDYLRVAYKES